MLKVAADAEYCASSVYKPAFTPTKTHMFRAAVYARETKRPKQPTNIAKVAVNTAKRAHHGITGGGATRVVGFERL